MMKLHFFHQQQQFHLISSSLPQRTEINPITAPKTCEKRGANPRVKKPLPAGKKFTQRFDFDTPLHSTLVT